MTLLWLLMNLYLTIHLISLHKEPRYPHQVNILLSTSKEAAAEQRMEWNGPSFKSVPLVVQ